MSTNIYTIYQEQHDITFIMQEEIHEEGYVCSLEVVGFYYGEPNDKCTELFRGSLKASFD